MSQKIEKEGLTSQVQVLSDGSVNQAAANPNADVAPPPKKTMEVTDKTLFPFIVVGGCILSFNGGYMNCVALRSYMGETVSHVSGHITKASIELGTLSMGDFANECGLLFFFMLGAAFSGWFIGKEKLTLGLSYGRLLFCTGTVVFIAMMSGMKKDEHEHRSYFAMYMLCVGCGMQNAMTTRYSGAVLRTTHMTGMATDVGLVIGHLMRRDRDYNDGWKLALFIPMMLCFFFGGSAAVQVYMEIGLWALWPSIVLLCGSGVVYIMFIARLAGVTFVKSLARNVLQPHTQHIIHNTNRSTSPDNSPVPTMRKRADSDGEQA